LESEGLVTRRRDPNNRRVHIVELSKSGDALFQQLRTAAAAFDKRLRTGLDDAEIATLAELLDRLQANAGRES
jgi:MarR family transcriptional regulator for hemolysin